MVKEHGLDSKLLLPTIERSLESNLNRRMLSVERNAAWQVVHGTVAYGERLPMTVDGNKVLAIDYLFGGGTMRGWDISAGRANPQSKRPGVSVRVEAGSYVGQGHTDQFIGYFSQVPLPLDRKIDVDGQSLSVEDWGRMVQWSVPDNPYREYSWTLIALTNLFPDEIEWQASDGKTWTLEPLVGFEAKQDLTTSPCGGMHRLMGLAHAVRYWQQKNQPFTAGWSLAQSRVKESIDTIRRFQNTDGTFSANYTLRPGTSSDLSNTIGTTGHTLEFLAYALPKEELHAPWLEKAVFRLCHLLDAASQVELECGGLYHGLAGLRLYRDRIATKE